MKSDLHLHTSFSWDAVSSPENIVKAALRENLDCIAITDHNTTQGVKRALQAAQDEPLLVIPGIEISSKSGDIVGLNVKKDIPGGLSAQETITRIKKQNGLAIIPHPFHFFIGFKNIFAIMHLMDGVEIFNAKVSYKANQKALDWGDTNDFSFTAGSDAHSSLSVGKAFVESESFENPHQLIEKIKKREIDIKSKSIDLVNFKRRSSYY